MFRVRAALFKRSEFAALTLVFCLFPPLNNLWNYLSHFYDKMEPSEKKQFSFENSAGIYTENGLPRLFALCIRYAEIEGLKILPEGNYLCVDCTEENRTHQLEELLQIANKEHHTRPEFTIQQIVVSGILQWNYQVQVLALRSFRQ